MSRPPFGAPMGAVSYSPKRLVMPCYLQPKLDGIRCVTNGRVFISRQGNKFHRANMAHLMVDGLDEWYDGELIVPGVAALGDIASIVKRRGHPRSGEIEFHVFDIQQKDRPFESRIEQLFEEFAERRFPRKWVKVQTRMAVNQKEIAAFHRTMAKAGLEGTMVRDPAATYRKGKRADSTLLKWKFTQDKEFRIVGVKEASGKDAGTPVFRCGVGKGGVTTTFDVRPMGSMELRRQMWHDRKRLIGKKLTVRFAGFTRNGKPFHPRGIAVRDYE